MRQYSFGVWKCFSSSRVGVKTSLTLMSEEPPSQPVFHMFSASRHTTPWGRKKIKQHRTNQHSGPTSPQRDPKESTLTLVQPREELWGTLNLVQSRLSWRCRRGSWLAGSPWWQTTVLQQHGKEFPRLVIWAPWTHPSSWLGLGLNLGTYSFQKQINKK